MPDATGSRNGHVITFYSYKGGCGRTMALANTGWVLAANGYRVLAIDWDLESPGLHRYYQPFMLDPDLRRTEGLIELLQQYAAGRQAESPPEDLLARSTRLDSAAFSLTWTFPGGGGLDFLPAGKQDRRYSPKVSHFDWDWFWQEGDGPAFIRAFGTAMREQYDFVLIDSRTGLSDSSGICTMVLPDAVVNCFALNRQGVEGAVAVARGIDNAGVRVYPLPGRVESGEQMKLQHGRDDAQNRFRVYTDKLGLDIEQYWSAVEVPYRAYYAYEEILAVFADRPREPNTVLAPYVALAGLLAGRTLSAPEIAERQRQSVVSLFERSGTSARLKVLVRYATIDRVWAEWIRQELTRLGHECTLLPPGDPAPALDGIDKVVVLLSKDGLAYGTLDQYWAPQLKLADLRAAEALVAMRVNGPPLPISASVAGTVDFPNLTAEAAFQAMLKALGIRNVAVSEAPAEDSTIRYPSEHARIWRVPALRNPSFIGRDDVIERLRDQLQQQDLPVALIGMSGVGKSAIALEYLYRFAASYDIVWYIPAASEELVQVGFEELGAALELPAVRDPDRRLERVHAALRERRSSARWLVVLDSAEDPALLAKYVPRGPGHTIITTRDPAWSGSAHVEPVDVFQRHESIALLNKRNAGLTGDEADTLAERLGDLPVAVESSGDWLATTARTVGEYLELLGEHAGDEAALPGDDAPLPATFAVALESLRAQNTAASRLVELLAFLAPSPIPTTLLRSRRIIEDLAEHGSTVRDSLTLSRLVQHAGRFGLIKSDPASHTISMHVLAQLAVRRSLDAAGRERTRRAAMEAVAEINPGDADNAGNWPLYEQLRPHVEELGAADAPLPAVRPLIIDLVRYLRLRGQSAACEQLAERALRAWTAAGADPDDIDTILLRFQYANVLRDFGKLDEAHRIDADLLERLTRVVGPGDPYTLMVAGSYAQDLREQGRWAEAEEREQQTFALIRPALGDDHPRTLMAANNYAVTLRLAGRYAEAAELDRQTYDKRRRVLGEEHPFTLSSADACGTDDRDLGDLQGSRSRLQRTYEASRRVHGDEHLSTLLTMRNLATTHRWLGQTAQAENLLQLALPRYERVLGREHPATIGCRVELASVLSDQGDDAAALRLVAAAERSYRTIFAAEHPLCLVARNNLGVFTRKTGDLARGLALAEEAAAGFLARLGEQHTITALSWINVANAMWAQIAVQDPPDPGAVEAALELDERAYQVLRAALRPENIAAIGSMVNYTVGRMAAGDYDERFRAEAVRFAEEVLGAEHPITRRGRAKERIDLDIEPFVI